MNNPTREVAIIGSGPAGLTAAIYTARANLNPVLIQGQLPGGQLTTTTEVENFPGFTTGIMGPELMQKMEEQAKRFGTEILHGIVSEINFQSQPFAIHTDNGAVISSKTIIFATGASPRLLGLPNEKELMGYGLSTCATCDGAFCRDMEIVVVGGGDSACEEALFLTKFGKRVRLIHRRDELRASKIMADRTLAHPKIEVVWNSVPVALIGTKESGVTGMTLRDVQTGAKFEIDCQAVFYAIGHLPNSQLVRGSIEIDTNGYVVTAPNSTKTSLPGIFACGDLQDSVFRQAITAAGSGCMAAIEAERFLAEHE